MCGVAVLPQLEEHDQQRRALVKDIGAVKDSYGSMFGGEGSSEDMP